MASWIIFNLFILAMLFLDLGIVRRTAHVIRFKEALFWSALWILLALLFNVGLYFTHDTETALNFLAGYLIEKSLSVDNLFVILLIFNFFRVPSLYRHRILFWGVISALLFRGLFIAAGLFLITKVHFILYIFAVFLIYTGFKLAMQKEQELHPERNLLIRWCRKWMPITSDYENGFFFVKKNEKWHATPLLLVLLAIETSDLLFALDSIPAIMAITLDPFIVYTSNIFAILGLRSIFFALSESMELFHLLHYGLSAILIFVGFKMLLANFYPIPIYATLGFIVLILILSIAASLFYPKK